MPNIFISYSSKDRTLLDELAADIELLLDGWPVWFDRELNRSGGHHWWNLICEQIRACDIFIYALSPYVLKSEPCRREYAYARDLGKPILPVVIADVEIRYLPVELQAAQLVNFRQRSRDQQRSLKESLRNMPPAPPLPANALDLAPAAPLDPIGVLFDRITRLTTDADQQRLIILDIEDLNEEQAFQPSVPDLLTRLLERDDVLTVRNLRRTEELRSRVASAAPPLPPVGAGFIPPPASPSPAASFLPAPFAWIDIPGTLGKTWTGAPYSLAKYPTTNAQFALFMAAGGYQERQWWTEAGWKARGEGWHYDGTWKPSGKPWTQPRYWTDAKWKGAEQPVVGVSWYEAVAFCSWLSEASGEKIMLPTEDQWQYAAQGADGRAYPWGSDWDCKKCNNSVKPCDSNVTTLVRQYEGKGDSPFGVVDMAGNVWEWCLTDYDNRLNDINSAANNRVLRGGSWDDNYTDYFRCDFRNRDNPEGRYFNFGFRVSRS